MAVKKPVIALSSFHPMSWTCPQCSHATRKPRVERNMQYHKQYATVSDSASYDALAWPKELANKNPSPYEIFNQKKEDPYSKRRFYELVKVYHPDRAVDVEDSSGEKCTQAVMLERYRMVIAANAILSDPAKREAYDRFGLGWSEQPKTETRRTKYSTYHRWRSDGSAAYKWPVDQDPMYNATWEDWERWYHQQFEQARQKRQQEQFRQWGHGFFSGGRPGNKSQRRGVYANNYAFFSFVFVLAALGGAGQATRVNEQSRQRIERGRILSDESSKLLQQARQETRVRSNAGESKEGRIRRFLSDTGDYAEGDFDARALRHGDESLCAPGLTKDQDVPKFWEKPPPR